MFLPSLRGQERSFYDRILLQGADKEIYTPTPTRKRPHTRHVFQNFPSSPLSEQGVLGFRNGVFNILRLSGPSKRGSLVRVQV